MEPPSATFLEPNPTSQLLGTTEHLLQPVAEHNAKLQSTLAPIPTQQYQSPYASAPALASSASISPVISQMSSPVFSDQVNEILARVRASSGNAVERGSPQWEEARKAVMKEMTSQSTPTSFSIPSLGTPGSRKQARTGGRRGRGPRPRVSPIASEAIDVPSPNGVGISSAPLPSSGRGTRGGRVNRGGRPRGSRGGRGSMRSGKRKRANGEEDNTNDTDSSENFTPLPTQSRSGRKIFQAATTTSTIKIDDETTEPTSSTVTHPAVNGIEKKRKGNTRRTPGAAAVCKNCGRGHSPSSNVIVFCDGCNTPWHQHCHDPVIKGDLLQILEADWFCDDCTVLREEKSVIEGRVAGESMGLAEKRQYLQTLPQAHLVSLLLHACALHPSLPLFLARVPPASTISLSSTALDTPGLVTDLANTAIAEAEEFYEEDDVLPYPKAGNGVQLPPECDDVDILLDEDIVTFSHSWMEGSKLMRANAGFLGIVAGEVISPAA